MVITIKLVIIKKSFASKYIFCFVNHVFRVLRISSKSISIAKCPNCYNNKIEWMPIPRVDLDKLTYSAKEGLELRSALKHTQLGDHREEK
jgi:hypothetical protein